MRGIWKNYKFLNPDYKLENTEIKIILNRYSTFLKFFNFFREIQENHNN